MSHANDLKNKITAKTKKRQNQSAEIIRTHRIAKGCLRTKNLFSIDFSLIGRRILHSLLFSLILKNMYSVLYKFVS